MTFPSPKYGMVLPDDDGTVRLVYHRDLDCRVEETWRWITDYDRLAAWIGRVEGEPAPGASVQFYATTDRVEPTEAPQRESIRIDVCAAPTELALDWVIPGKPLWRVLADVAPVAYGSILRLTHQLVDPSRSAQIGAGWHYLLDRLDAAREARPLPTWDGYVTALQGRYGPP